MGLTSTEQLRPWHLMRRTSATETKHYGEIFEYIEKNSLKNSIGSSTGAILPNSFSRAMAKATAESFHA